MTSEVRPIILQRLRELVVRHTGLDFSAEREPDLWRGLVSAAAEAGFEHAEAYVDHLLAASLSESQIQRLASHLTVGETYFLRDPHAFAALDQEVFPRLLAAAREGGRRRLRLWSAACCTGEEAYSLAIAVRRACPGLAEGDVEILGSDISPRFLERAARGVFGEWSFRDTAPEFRQRYFKSLGNRQWEILPEIRRMVRFFPLNLVDAVYPPARQEEGKCDVVFCRNALIYFNPDEAARVVRKLTACVAERGWLVLGPNELCYGAIPSLSAVRFPGAILHRKSAAASPHPRETGFDADASEGGSRGFLPWEKTAGVEPATDVPLVRAEFERTGNDGTLFLGTAESAADRPGIAPTPSVPALAVDREAAAPAHLLESARALADQGRLGEALAECDRLLALHKLEPSAHFLRAIVFEEMGERESAVAALRRALYLEPDFVPAHLNLGNLMRGQGRWAEAGRHFENALALVRNRPADELVAGADGLTAGRIAQMIEAVRTARDATSQLRPGTTDAR